MRYLILLPCFIFTISALFSSVSYGFSFDFDMDKLTVKSGTSTFVDDFDDGIVPPSGPSGPTTYVSNFPISSNRESGGVLNLNYADGNTFPGDDVLEVVVGLQDPTYFFASGVGGSVEGKFSFANGFPVDGGFDIGITSLVAFGDEIFLGIDMDASGKIFASVDSFDINDVEISSTQLDITSSLLGVTDITLRLDIDTASEVTAYFDIGSTGSFIQMSGSHILSLPPGSNYIGNFSASEAIPEPVPEPATVALLGIGLVGLAGAEVKRRRKNKAVDKPGN